MKVCVSAKELKGKIAAVSSKSDAHRAVICAALCDGETEVQLGEFSDDISATADCLSAMGAKVMLSNSDPHNVDENDNFFDDLYADFTILRVDASRAINSKGTARGKIKELLIKNY